MQLEQQETFELHGPQLEVFGEIENRLPPPARKRPAAALVLAALALVSVFGIGGAKLKGAGHSTAALYSSETVDAHGNSIQTDFADAADSAANLIRLAGSAAGQDDPAVQAAAQALEGWNAAPHTPAAQYAANTALYSTVDALYSALDHDPALQAQLDDEYDDFISSQEILRRETTAYNEAAAQFNKQKDRFPANVIGTLWDVKDVELYAPRDNAAQ